MTGAQDMRSGATITLVILCGMNLLDYIDRNILAAVLPNIQAEMGLSSTQAGALGPAFLIAYTLSAPLMGWAGDRYNRIPPARRWCGPVEPRHHRGGVRRHLWTSGAGAQSTGHRGGDVWDTCSDDPG